MFDINRFHIFMMQILLVGGITFGSQSINFDKKHNWLVNLACYVFYILIIQGSQEIYSSLFNLYNKNYNVIINTIDQAKNNFALFASSTTLAFSKEELFGERLLVLFAASLVVNFVKEKKRPQILKYGVGMACSYFEGYLAHVIPPEGSYVGLQNNIRKYEAKHGVVFPVRRLFIIITKDMYCPPDLKDFNKQNRFDIPYLESCQPLDAFEKDVAGVKNRKYQNSVYMIQRPHGQGPVFLSATSALNTFYKVLRNKDLCDILKNINVDEVVGDFCKTIIHLINDSCECRDKCELVFYDNTDPKQNLADVLLEKIRKLEQNFEHIIEEETSVLGSRSQPRGSNSLVIQTLQ